MKRLKYTIVFFYLALFVFLALHDERRAPELARALAAPRSEVIEPGNAWLAMLGIDAPAGASPIAFAAKRMRDIEKAIRDANPTGEIIVAPADGSKLSFKGKLPPFGGKTNRSAVAYAQTHPAEIAALCRDNAELLRRYEQLHTRTSFNEPLEYGYDAPFPHFAPMRSAQRLLFLRLALQAGQGDVTGALARLRDDLAFWRLVARNARTLFSKLMSVAAIHSDLTLAADLGSSRALSPPELAMVKELLRPFDKEEVCFAMAIQGEALYCYYSMEKNLGTRLKRWSPERLTTKRNATANRIYACFSEVARQAALSPQHYTAERKRHASRMTELFKIGVAGLYNPTGEILARIAIPQLSGYIERGHHMEGLRRLALLKVLAHAEQLPPERMQAFFDAHATDLGNPYTAKPMQWDATNQRMHYPTVSGDGSIELFF